uniref:Secreted protein n=1 Tax=Steinernema glaseri TaxID=37863 RepID=A0A1I7ZLE4_9BILA
MYPALLVPIIPIFPEAKGHRITSRSKEIAFGFHSESQSPQTGPVLPSPDHPSKTDHFGCKYSSGKKGESGGTRVGCPRRAACYQGAGSKFSPAGAKSTSSHRRGAY